MSSVSIADRRIIAEMKPAYRADRTTEAQRLLEVFTADVSQFDPPTDLEGVIVTVRDLLDALGDVLDTIELDGIYRTTREENIADRERDGIEEAAFERGYDSAKQDAIRTITATLFDREQSARYDTPTRTGAPLADADFLRTLDYLRDLSESLTAAVSA